MKWYVVYRMPGIIMAWVTFSDLTGPFCCLKPLCPSSITMCWLSNMWCREPHWW